ncbi:MAG: HAD family hydrolase [Desulfobacterales bacterium]|nr:HAD family hydrolase [Desulfobacterales bacterium]
MTDKIQSSEAVLFFDFDGVILDSVHVKTDAFVKIYAEHGPNIMAKVREYHLDNLGISRYDKFRYYNEVLLGREFTDQDSISLDYKFNLLITEGLLKARFVPGVYEILKWACHMRLHTYIVSAAPKVELLEICEKRGIKSFFTEIYGIPDKKADVMAQVIVNRGISPKQCVMFGDSCNDLQAARKIGVYFVGINAIDRKFFIKQGASCLQNFNELDRYSLLTLLKKEKSM